MTGVQPTRVESATAGWGHVAQPPPGLHLDPPGDAPVYRAAGDASGRQVQMQSPMCPVDGELLASPAHVRVGGEPVGLLHIDERHYRHSGLELTWTPEAFGVAGRMRADVSHAELVVPLAAVERGFDDRDLTRPLPVRGNHLLAMHRWDHEVDYPAGAVDGATPFVAAFRRVLSLQSSVEGHLDEAGVWRVPLPPGETVEVHLRIRWPLVSGADTYPTHDGGTQLWRTVVPPHLGAGPVPLFVGLHGAGVGADNFMMLTHPCWSASIKLVMPMLLGAVLIIPNHNDSATLTGEGAQVVPWANGADQEAFVFDAIDEAKRRFPIDERRVYAMGISNGGNAALTSVTLHPDRFALAIATVPASDWAAIGYDAKELERVVPDHLQFSPINLAENLLHTPVSMRGCAQDQLDGRVQVGRMAERLERLGYRHRSVVTEVGHHVDYETIEGGYEQGLEFVLERPAVDPSPDRVLYRTFDLRWPGAFWARIGETTGPGLAELDVTRDVGANRLTIRLRNVRRLVVDADLAGLRVDDVEVDGEADAPCIVDLVGQGGVTRRIRVGACAGAVIAAEAST